MDVQPAVLIAHILTALTIQLARLLTAVMTLPLLAPNTEELGTVLIVNTAQRLLIAVRRPTVALITPWLVRKRGNLGWEYMSDAEFRQFQQCHPESRRGRVVIQGNNKFFQQIKTSPEIASPRIIWYIQAMASSFCYFNGKIVPADKSLIHPDDLGILRGYGVLM